MNFRKIITGVSAILILALAAYAYWYFMLRTTAAIPVKPTDTSTNQGFQPLNPNTTPSTSASGGKVLSPNGDTKPTTSGSKVPALRLLSSTPAGGYSASSTTATSTIIRWVDRGRGNVYQTSGDSLEVSTLSNTVVPRVFNAIWNKKLDGFIGSLYEGNNLAPSTVYAELSKPTPATTATSSIAMYELHGTAVRGTVIGYAASPDRSRLLIVVNENDTAVGYTTSFNGQNMVRVFSTPMTQIQVAWPTDSVIAVTTKGSAGYSGFLYFVNPKTGIFTKILGPLSGLATTVSHDGKNVLYSVTGDADDVLTRIYSISKATSTDAVIKTLADKCTWGRSNTTQVYCGVPAPLPSGVYPDAWNLGVLTTSDKLWRLDAVSGELKLIASLPDLADRLIDSYRFDTDPHDHFLFFMNKTDLTLWSFDLSSIK